MAASRKGKGAEAGQARRFRPRPPDELPLAELEFTGCKAVPMSYEELLRFEGRLEVWDAGTRTAWMVSEPTSPTHENPSHGLAGLVERIGAVRGSPIKCYGAMDLLVRDARGKPRRVMQADQTVYLYPSRVDLFGSSAMVVGEHPYPDVVLEVDHSATTTRVPSSRTTSSPGFAPKPNTGSRLSRSTISPTSRASCLCSSFIPPP